MLERVKDPLQTLVSRDQYETAYAVLAHFLLIAQRAPILFSQVGRPVQSLRRVSPGHCVSVMVSVCTEHLPLHLQSEMEASLMNLSMSEPLLVKGFLSSSCS